MPPGAWLRVENGGWCSSGIHPDAFENHPNPWVHLAILETFEGFCKHQITSDIKCGEVEPGSDIHILTLVSQVSQLWDEQIDKVHNSCLLLP